MTTETIAMVTASDIRELMTSPAMEPALVLFRPDSSIDARSALYAKDFPSRYTVLLTRDDVIDMDREGGEDYESPSEAFCIAMADYANEHMAELLPTGDDEEQV